MDSEGLVVSAAKRTTVTDNTSTVIAGLVNTVTAITPKQFPVGRNERCEVGGLARAENKSAAARISIQYVLCGLTWTDLLKCRQTDVEYFLIPSYCTVLYGRSVKSYMWG